MDKKTIAAMRRHLREQNRNYLTGVFVEIPKQQWPTSVVNEGPDQSPVRVLRSRDFLVQVFEAAAMTRLSVNRTELGSDGRWKGDITWDELQVVKSQCGYGDRDAVEAYPKEGDIVNVANMRHLWIVPEDYAQFFWRNGKGVSP